MLVEGKETYIPANSNGLTRTTSSSRALGQRLFCLLQRKQQLTLNSLAQIHGQILLNGFSRNKNFLLVNLLSFYIRSAHHLLSAHYVFNDIESPSTTLWNQMIRAHARTQTPTKSLQLFSQMLLTDARPDGYTYSFLLAACMSSLSLREGQQVHAKVLANGYYSSNVFLMSKLVHFYAAAAAAAAGGGGNCDALAYARRVFDDMAERNVVSWNSMLAAYMRCRNLNGARRIFDEMPERNVVSWTTMISGYGKNGKCKQALNLFDQMRRAHVELDQVVLVAALTACAELGDLILGRWIHSYIQKTFVGSNQRVLISLNNALIHMYASCGMIEEAYEIFRWMPERSTVSWTSLITAFAKQGYAQEALQVFDLMHRVGAEEARPDDITFIGVLCACSHAGLVDEGRQFFKDMIQYWGIKPRIEHYGCMVDLLSRAGFLDEAQDLIDTMPIKPNDAVWGALLGGCRIHHNAEHASHVSEKLMVELDSDKAAGYLSLLAHVYATAEKWQDVANVRQKMVAMGAKKPAGRSWVHINQVVHDFVAGDRTHKNTSSVYEMLGIITGQAKLEGYKPDISKVLSDVDEERGRSAMDGGRSGVIDDHAKYLAKYNYQLGETLGDGTYADVRIADYMSTEFVVGRSKTNVKIADFGLSDVLPEDHLFETHPGTIPYVSPEVLSEKWYAGSPADVWSCGIVLYVMLCKALPMYDESSCSNVIQNIKGGKYTLPGHLSDDARDLIARILIVDPMKRMTIPQIRSSNSSTPMVPGSPSPLSGCEPLKNNKTDKELEVNMEYGRSQLIQSQENEANLLLKNQSCVSNGCKRAKLQERNNMRECSFNPRHSI